MRAVLRLGAVAAFLFPVVALADQAPEPEPEPVGAEPKLLPTSGDPVAPTAPAPREDRSHKGQLMLSLRAALGGRAIVTYGGDVYCGASDNSTSSGNAPVCVSRAPFTFDLELGYGIARRLDLFFEMRFGLEEDFGALASSMAGPRMVKLSPGARYFYSEGRSSKLFSTGQVVFDFTGYEDAAGQSRGADFGLRNMNGIWFDLAREYGFYLYFAETATFARWFNFDVEAGIGISGRFSVTK